MVRCAVAVCLVLWVSPAGADAVAESLFQEGVEDLKESRFDDACRKLKASFEREARSGTLMTLAQCESLRGRTATAWDMYKRAAGIARREGRQSYADKATELAAELEPKLMRLQIDADPAVKVTVDGEPIAPEAFGVAVAMDPGRHVVDAKADGRRDWHQEVSLEKEGQTTTVAVPELEHLPAPPPPAIAPEPAVDASPVETSGGIPVWTWVAGGVGVASLAVSGVFLGQQLAVKNDLDERCGGTARTNCPPIEDYDAEGEHSREKLLSGLFIGFGVAGIVGLGVGAAGLAVGLSGPKETASLLPQPYVGPNGGGLVWRGTL